MHKDILADKNKDANAKSITYIKPDGTRTNYKEIIDDIDLQIKKNFDQLRKQYDKITDKPFDPLAGQSPNDNGGGDKQIEDTDTGAGAV